MNYPILIRYFRRLPPLRKLHAPGFEFCHGRCKGKCGVVGCGKSWLKRPAHVDPNFIQDGSDPSCDYEGFLPFFCQPSVSSTLHPASLYPPTISPRDFGTGIVPGYYCPDNRALRIKELLDEKGKKIISQRYAGYPA